MSTKPPPPPALLVASVLGRSPALVDAALDGFARLHGEVGYASQLMTFPWTDFYGDELGPEPSRRVVALRPLLENPGELGRIKRACCRLEVSLGRRGEGRQVNIDPGTVNEQQLVLASTKRRGHRLYLGQGIYGELALLWGNDCFEALPWTYPDYAGDELREVFTRLRRIYLAARRGQGETEQ